MKKLIITILILVLFPLCALSDDDWDGVYENQKEFEKPVPAITDKQFKDAYDFKMGKGKKKKKKDPYSNIKANDMSSLNDLDGSYPSIMLTQKIYTDDHKILDVGHYKVVVVIPKKANKPYVIHFYQGHSHKGKLVMTETNNDYDEKEINYAKMIHKDNHSLLIYGNIDCNLECVLSIVE